MSEEIDRYWMSQALLLAKAAADAGEVPVGAVLVRDQVMLGSGFNRSISSCDPTAHAEVLALREAASVLENHRIIGATLYVTLEPCVMCAGALVQARIRRLVFAASEPKAGAICSQCAVLDMPHLNHRVLWQQGVCADASSQLLSDFFRARRDAKKALKTQNG